MAVRAQAGGGSAWIVWVIVGAVVLACAIGGAIAYAILEADRSRSEARENLDRLIEREARELAEREAAPEPDPPKAEVGRAIAGEAAGSQFWLVPYTNTGASPISRPHVTVTTFDGSGSRVAEEVGYARVDRLDPGETTIVLVVAQTRGSYERFDVAPADPSVATYEKIAPATVSEWRVEKPDYGLPTLVGFVKNDGSSSLRFVTVEAIGKNRMGEVVAYGNTFVNDDDLGPGESSGFSLTVGVWQVEEPATWSLAASGRP
jgi:hypothetical protein